MLTRSWLHSRQKIEFSTVVLTITCYLITLAVGVVVTPWQGRNFGLKSGVPIKVRSEREGRWGRSIPSSSDSGVWKSVVSSLSGVQGGAPVENGLL